MSIDNANPQTRTTNEKLECQKGTAHSTKNTAQQIMKLLTCSKDGKHNGSGHDAKIDKLSMYCSILIYAEFFVVVC